MYKNRYYYFLKMFIPRATQIQLRRMLIRRKMRLHQDIWPIDPQSATPPEGWQGWPEQKSFALVITHDVESKKGLDNCRALMDLEEKYGFRSSFNFVAGDYDVPQDLLDEMRRRGFEIGIHGFHHNGNLFRSKKIFKEHAAKINQAIERWGASGFRAPSMYHNLDWLHELNIRYDASTFDTDPFEPQPDAAKTIFPFHVTAEGKQGYIELPYTLPQDFLLFILMQEKDTRIWENKLRWIVDQGGMALFITHPDYIRFDSGPLNAEQYPAKYYEDFLRHIKTTYEGQYWHALPRDMAVFWPSEYTKTGNARRKKRHICMMAYSFYESDNRIMRYADALAERGDDVEVIALQNEGTDAFERIRNVNVYRIQKRLINEKNKLTYLTRLLTFLLKSMVTITKKHYVNPYDAIHIHSVPDFEVFAAWIPKIKGAGIILDIHDIVPEFYASKFGTGKDSIIFKALVSLERLSIKFSNHVIISNHLWYKTLTARSVDQNKCTTVMNYPDEAIFYPRLVERTDNKFIMIYPGTLGWHQGLDVAIKAFARIKDQAPQAEFHIYGRGTEKENLSSLIDNLSLKDRVFLKDPKPIDQIAQVMAGADLGIVPKRNDPFGGEAFSTKILEFMSLGIPVIVSRTKIDSFYFNDSVVQFFEPDNDEDLAKAMLLIINSEEHRSRLKENTRLFVEDFKWSKKKDEYFRLVDSVIKHKP